MIARRSRADAFTLIEILLASMGAALVLAALYGIFIHAVRLRDTATERVRDARLRARAESVIRADLKGAYISGGTLASILEGGTNNNGGPGGASLPGYLKFTTTTGRDTGTDLYGDVQQVEYYLAADPAASTASGKTAGILVRAVTRDLLSATTTGMATTTPAFEEQILRGVQSWTVEFYDGSNWQQTWSYDSAAAALTNGGSENSGTVITTGNTSLPDAVRIRVQPAPATPNGHLSPPIEVLVPWTTQPFAGSTPSTSTAQSSTENQTGANALAKAAAERRAALWSSTAPTTASAPTAHWRVGRTPMKRAPSFPVSMPRQHGSVLIVVLVVCLGLVSLTLVFGHAMLMAYRGEDNALAGRQADAAIVGAEQYAEVVLGNVVTNQGPARGHVSRPIDVPERRRARGRRVFLVHRRTGAERSGGHAQVGLVDEASKLNLNSASVTMLLNVPGMTADLAQAIVQWRTSTGASTDGSSSVSVGTVKGAPFESPSELELVNGGTDPSVLYGDDTNLNHISDPEENTLTSLGQFNPGLLEYVTVFSRESNTLSDGTRRVNITNPAASAPLRQLLTQTFGGAQANAILGRFSQGPGRPSVRVHSVLEFYRRSGMTAAQLDQITPKITAASGNYAVGLVNVNTASATVLACVPGITTDMANNIVAARTTPTVGVTTNLAWVVPILGGAATIAGPYLTAQSYQVSADVAAVGRFGRGYRRTLFVLDNSSGTPQIVYRRNLAALGWALGKDARTALAAQATAQNGGTPSPR